MTHEFLQKLKQEILSKDFTPIRSEVVDIIDNMEACDEGDEEE